MRTVADEEVDVILFEPAVIRNTRNVVDDFAARCGTDIGASDWNVRAMNYMAAAEKPSQSYATHFSSRRVRP